MKVRERNNRIMTACLSSLSIPSAAQNVWNLGVTWEWKGEDEWDDMQGGREHRMATVPKSLWVMLEDKRWDMLPGRWVSQCVHFLCDQNRYLSLYLFRYLLSYVPKMCQWLDLVNPEQVFISTSQTRLQDCRQYQDIVFCTALANMELLWLLASKRNDWN